MAHYAVVAPRPGLPLVIGAEKGALVKVAFGSEWPGMGWVRNENDPVLVETARQLALYFDGKLRDFDLPLEFSGTEFQRRVWAGLLAIRYGETRSYGELAKEIGAPGAARAVGAANHANPIAIVVPCHRVIEGNGGLGGYGGGLDVKRMLLELEGAALSPRAKNLQQSLFPDPPEASTTA